MPRKGRSFRRMSEAGVRRALLVSSEPTEHLRACRVQAKPPERLAGVAAGLDAGLEVLEPGAGSRHPPAEFLASPGTLGRIGVDDGAVAEDPAVHHQA